MPDRSDARLIYITTDGTAEARMIGHALVESRLAACANILDRDSICWSADHPEKECPK